MRGSSLTGTNYSRWRQTASSSCTTGGRKAGCAPQERLDGCYRMKLEGTIWFVRPRPAGNLTTPLTLRNCGHDFIDSFDLHARMLQSATRYAARHLVGGIVRIGNREDVHHLIVGGCIQQWECRLTVHCRGPFAITVHLRRAVGDGRQWRGHPTLEIPLPRNVTSRRRLSSRR